MRHRHAGLLPHQKGAQPARAAARAAHAHAAARAAAGGLRRHHAGGAGWRSVAGAWSGGRCLVFAPPAASAVSLGPASGPAPLQCPADNTCCCMREFFGFCFTWACCPLPSATCCDDQQHCCPEDLPVCDTVAGRCLAKAGTIEGSAPWVQKVAASRTSRAWFGPFRPRRAHVN